MNIRTGHVIHPLLQHLNSFRFYTLAISTAERKYIQLEFHAGRFQVKVVAVGHVDIPLGVCQDGMVAFGLDSLQHAAQVHRRVEIGGFHQQMVPLFAYREQVVSLQPLLEEVVEHVFGREMQPDCSGIASPQLREALAQEGRFVGNILHDVRGEPHGFYSQLLVPAEYCQRLLHRAHPIVHPGQDVAMPIGKSPEKSRFGQRPALSERPQNQ